MLKKRVSEFVGFQVVKFVASFLYIAGLTSLIPLLPLFLSPDKLIAAKSAFLFALGMIVISFLFIYWFAGSRKIALRSIGLMTLVPGMLAVFFSYAPHHMTRLMGLFGAATPYVKTFFMSRVPNAWLLAGIYIILGVGLIWLSFRGEK